MLEDYLIKDDSVVIYNPCYYNFAFQLFSGKQPNKVVSVFVIISETEYNQIKLSKNIPQTTLRYKPNLM